jgi:hypothetical protein
VAFPFDCCFVPTGTFKDVLNRDLEAHKADPANIRLNPERCTYVSGPWVVCRNKKMGNQLVLSPVAEDKNFQITKTDFTDADVFLIIWFFSKYKTGGPGSLHSSDGQTQAGHRVSLSQTQGGAGASSSS